MQGSWGQNGIIFKYFFTIYCFIDFNAIKLFFSQKVNTKTTNPSEFIYKSRHLCVNNVWYLSLSLISDYNSVHKTLFWVWKHMWLHPSHSWLCLLAKLLCSIQCNVRNHHQLPECVAFWLTFLTRFLKIFWTTANWTHLLLSRTQPHKAVLFSSASPRLPALWVRTTYFLVLRTNSLPKHFSTDVLIQHFLFLLNNSLSNGTYNYWRHHCLGPMKHDREAKYPHNKNRDKTVAFIESIGLQDSRGKEDICIKIIKVDG